MWYNIGQVAIGIGDLGLAYQAFKISISVDANHAESYANLGVRRRIPVAWWGSVRLGSG